MDTALHVVCQHLAVLVGYRAPQLLDVPLHSADLKIGKLVTICGYYGFVEISTDLGELLPHHHQLLLVAERGEVAVQRRHGAQRGLQLEVPRAEQHWENICKHPENIWTTDCSPEMLGSPPPSTWPLSSVMELSLATHLLIHLDIHFLISYHISYDMSDRSHQGCSW